VSAWTLHPAKGASCDFRLADSQQHLENISGKKYQDCFLELFADIFRLILYFPISALGALFGNILQNPAARQSHQGTVRPKKVQPETYFLVTTVLIYNNNIVATFWSQNGQEQMWDRWFHLAHDRMDIDIIHWHEDLLSLPAITFVWASNIVSLAQ
jgi:hypothetical protein